MSHEISNFRNHHCWSLGNKGKLKYYQSPKDETTDWKLEMERKLNVQRQRRGMATVASFLIPFSNLVSVVLTGLIYCEFAGNGAWEIDCGGLSVSLCHTEKRKGKVEWTCSQRDPKWYESHLRSILTLLTNASSYFSLNWGRFCDIILLMSPTQAWKTKRTLRYCVYLNISDSAWPIKCHFSWSGIL